MSEAPDDRAARRRALCDHSSTLLVEAAAGTGKTSLIAGRITLLLAAGVPPGSIAAITFTEFAAAELAARVRHYTSELLAGRVPWALRAALPTLLSDTQAGALREGADRLDELTVSTIHSFCQTMIRDYAIEAGIDPGAEVMDAETRALAFEAVFTTWLRGRMSDPAESGSAIAVLSRDDPRRVVKILKDLAAFRLEHRSAGLPAREALGRPDIDLVAAIEDFTRRAASSIPERHTLGLAAQLGNLADFYSGTLEVEPGFAVLWALASPPRQPCMRRDSLELLAGDAGRVWERLAAQDGAALGRLFGAVDAAFRALLGKIAAALVTSLSAEIDGLLDAYAAFKRSAALLDFDDLLEGARALIRDYGQVRATLGARFRHVLVDEFQDTDPVQCEILLRLTAPSSPADWRESTPAPGSLFVVGDPKQAIYRFRGAALEMYGVARAAVLRSQPDGVLYVTSNFRSRPGILRHVNSCFRGPLGREGQPGYVELSAIQGDAGDGLPCVARLEIGGLPPDPPAKDVRAAEAEAVARSCASLLSGPGLPRADGSLRRLAPGDIALLTPTGSDLWIYEQALEGLGLPVVSHAGKSLFRRQETQDLVALVRVLADAQDTLAFGALMRGPLVGLTDEELLDLTAALPPTDNPNPRLDVRTPPEHLPAGVARNALSTLRDLRRRARSASPAQLLSEAVVALDVRSKLRAREPFRGPAACANVDMILNRAGAYGVRGLVRLARDLDADWRHGVDAREGIVDAGREAIAIFTIHGSKGLEWPVVIPINTATRFRPRKPFVHRPSDDTLHWLVGDVVPPGLSEALAADAAAGALERERLWYVACTRASDLLVLPLLPAAPISWARVIDLAHAELPELNVSSGSRAAAPFDTAGRSNAQTREVFAAEAATIAAGSIPLRWVTPSDHDPDRVPAADPGAGSPEPGPLLVDVPGGGRVRGLVMHKLLEELMTGELEAVPVAVGGRAGQLVRQLLPLFPADTAEPVPSEMAGKVLAAMQLPDVARLWPSLVPEIPVFGMAATGREERPLAGRADALAIEEGRVTTVVDWKSDVDPSVPVLLAHVEQVRLYLAATGATEGILVYLSSGIVRRVDRQVGV